MFVVFIAEVQVEAELSVQAAEEKRCCVGVKLCFGGCPHIVLLFLCPTKTNERSVQMYGLRYEI